MYRNPPYLSNDSTKMWNHMPPTVHKVLIHGEKIIESFILPIGKFSEETQEVLNKVFRHCREFRARKMLRKSTNEDILNNLLMSSDPRISTLRPHCSFQNSIANKLFPETQMLQCLVTDDVLDNEQDYLLYCVEESELEETDNMIEIN
ncbi:hypothetical protein KPH14_001214 [Odynerus spinipes]|uniref:Uncharacterized protein n=1 Tax=Odynerus spinipes TaxID=1348599 RepID=A0AAD9VRZ4_9HYME|nr:hypothetical protein KPH14_001214 [Odynerus spinipes]